MGSSQVNTLGKYEGVCGKAKFRRKLSTGALFSSDIFPAQSSLGKSYNPGYAYLDSLLKLNSEKK